MKEATNKKTACILGWILVLCLPVALIVGVIAPWTNRINLLDDQIATSQDQLQRYQRLMTRLPALQAELEEVKKNEDFKAFYFDAATPALAGAGLQRKIQEIVSNADGRLISTQLLPEQKDEQPPRVRIRTQLQGSTETLLSVLYEIEQSRPFLFVDKVSIRSTARPAQPARPQRAQRSRRARRTPRQTAAQSKGELTVRLDIFGFALGKS